MKQVEKKVYKATSDNMIKINGKKYNIYDLPDGLVIDGNLSLFRLDLKTQPDLSKIIINGTLDLSWNLLREINPQLFPKEIDALYLRGCGLTETPNLSNIIVKGILDLSFNPLEEVNPDRLPKKCTGLELIECELTETPNLSETNITYLNIAQNEIIDANPQLLPQGIKVLECDNNNRITELDLSNAKKLEKLVCYKCNLTTLITNSKNLRYLDCSHNQNLNIKPKFLVRPKEFYYEDCNFAKISNRIKTLFGINQRTR